MATEEKGYNGWANYETWNVALWLGNEEGTYHDTRRMTREAWDSADETHTFTRRERAEMNLAHAVKEYVEEMLPDLGASMFADLLGAALSEVDWLEIARNYLDDVAVETE